MKRRIEMKNTIQRTLRRCLFSGILFLVLSLVWPSSTFATIYSQEAQIRVIDETYVTIYGLSVGDWDNDGDIELLANYDYYWPPLGTPELVAYVFESGSGYVEERRISNTSLQRSTVVISPPVQLIISDVDNDGLNELTYPGTLNGTRAIHVLNVTPTSYSEELSIPGDFRDIAVGDVDGDGLNELVGVTSSQLMIFTVDSSGYVLDWSTSASGKLVRIGNVDTDAYKEIVLGTGDVDISVYGFDGSTYVLEGTGESTGYGSMGIGIGDFDSDGNTEILRVGYWGAVVIYEQLGANWVVEDSWDVDPPNDNPRYAISGNLDGDPSEEIIIGYGNNAFAESFQIFKYNTSTSSYELDWTSGTLPGWGANLFVGDPDNDGYVELVTGSRSRGYVHVFSTKYELPPQPRPPTNPRAVLSGVNFHHVTLTWDLSPDDGAGANSVMAYDIYRNASYDSQGRGYVLYDTVPRGTNTYLDVLAGEGDPANHFYLVCAANVIGASNCTETQAGKSTRPLTRGPQLVSIPFVQSDESIETILQTVHWDKAWSYDFLSSKWKSYTSLKPYRGDLKTVNHTIGVWVNVTSECNLTVAGIVPAQTMIHLHMGWNLVGFPSFNSSFTVADLEATVAVERVEGFDSSAPPFFLRILQGTDLLLAGQAYWVKASEDSFWILSNF